MLLTSRSKVLDALDVSHEKFEDFKSFRRHATISSNVLDALDVSQGILRRFSMH